MTRVQYNAGEVDMNYKILEGIFNALDESGLATTTQHAIDQFELVDENGHAVPGDLTAKCKAICEHELIKATYQLIEDDVEFHRDKSPKEKRLR